MDFDRRASALTRVRELVTEALSVLEDDEPEVAAALREVIAYIDAQLSSSGGTRSPSGAA